MDIFWFWKPAPAPISIMALPPVALFLLFTPSTLHSLEVPMNMTVAIDRSAKALLMSDWLPLLRMLATPTHFSMFAPISGVVSRGRFTGTTSAPAQVFAAKFWHVAFSATWMGSITAVLVAGASVPLNVND